MSIFYLKKERQGGGGRKQKKKPWQFRGNEKRNIVLEHVADSTSLCQ